MKDFLENIDHLLLLFFNGLNAPGLDQIMFFISSKWSWLPIVILFVVLIVRKYRGKFWIPLLAAIICFAITDQASHLTKESVKRYRPTHNLEISEKIHVVNDYKGGQYGFFSGHAANSFGLALITLLFVRNKYYTYILIAWAILVSYSRMYLGVHYPSDILVGAVVGAVVAFGLWSFSKRIHYFRLEIS
ncbi:MAG: phosphatase PAP2 family protein [Bacteroidales bacterium]|nr:phosphatase PAP2 family protein [Bacteroidales bacterium]